MCISFSKISKKTSHTLEEDIATSDKDLVFRIYNVNMTGLNTLDGERTHTHSLFRGGNKCPGHVNRWPVHLGMNKRQTKVAV